MPDARVVVIGTSAGGLDALRTIAANLPANFPAPIAVVMHTGAGSPGVLAGILARAGPLPANAVTAVEPLNPATIYAAAPDYHLIVEPGRVRATRGPKENRLSVVECDPCGGRIDAAVDAHVGAARARGSPARSGNGQGARAQGSHRDADVLRQIV